MDLITAGALYGSLPGGREVPVISTPPPLDPNDVVAAMTGNLANQVIHVFTYAVPFIVGLLVLFTVLAAVKRAGASGLSGNDGRISWSEARDEGWLDRDWEV